MSFQFKIQNKHIIEYKPKYYFGGDSLEQVIKFLHNNDEYATRVYNYEELCFFGEVDLYNFGVVEVELSLFEDILEMLENDRALWIPDNMNKEELMQFVKDCIECGKNTGDIVYLEVF